MPQRFLRPYENVTRNMLDENRLEDLTCPLLAPVANRLDSNEKANRLWTPLRRSPALRVRQAVQPFAPEWHFLPCAEPYHSDSVIVGSASRRRYGGKWRALARATSASLTTRIPKAFELSSGILNFPLRRDAARRIRLGSLLNSGAFGRVGARANPNDRTYRRSGLEQRKSYELRGNRGSKLKQNLRFIFEGKSWSVSESWGNRISDLRAKGVSR